MRTNSHEHLVHVGAKYVFTRMQNITWATRGLGLSYLVEADAGNLLGEIIKSNSTKKPVVINFSRITDLDDHALDGFFESVMQSKKPVIIVDGNHLFKRIEQLRKERTVKIANDQANKLIVLGENFRGSYISIENERLKLIKKFKVEAVKGCLEKFPKKKRLSSTPVFADGEFNSNKLISDVKTFIWLCAFVADEIEFMIEKEKIGNPKLLSASLRGAPFAAAAALLLNIRYETIDHFGPKHKLFDSDFLDRMEKGTNYIFVGDFCIGGTEIKIAKTYTQMNGSFLNHAIVIGNQIEPNHFSEYFKLYSLVDLKKLGMVKYTI